MPRCREGRLVVIRLIGSSIFFENQLFDIVENDWSVGIACHGGVLRNIIHHKFPKLDQAVKIHNCCCYEIEVCDNVFQSLSLFH